MGRAREEDEGKSYHSLNSLPWGLFLISLIMKLARWQYSCAMTLNRRS